MTAAKRQTIYRSVMSLLALAACGSARAATGAEADLPWLPGPGIEAKQTLKEGLAAAEAGDWDAAIEKFRGAQALAPTWPATLFNLGWACDKAGGRLLPAAIWYRAYLAVEPEASDAPAVQRRIEELLDGVAASVERIMGMEEEVARAVPAKDSTTARKLYAQAWLKLGRPDKAWEIALTMPAGPESWVGDIVRGFAQSGQIDTAIRCAGAMRRMEADYHYRSEWALAYIVQAQARAGDVAGALETLPRVQTHGRIVALGAIAQAQAAKGEFAACRTLADDAASDKQRARVLGALASGLVERGDIEAAQEALESIPISERPRRAQVQAAVARRLLRQGRAEWRDYIEKARAELERTFLDGPASDSDHETEHFDAVRALVQIVADAGDIRGAKEILTSYDRYYFGLKPEPWYDLMRAAARQAELKTAPQQVWELLQEAKQKINASMFDLGQEQYLLCLSDVTETLAQRGAASPGAAEALDWAALTFAFGVRFYADLASFEAEARADPSKYTLLPSYAGNLHVGLERFRRMDSEWKAKRSQ